MCAVHSLPRHRFHLALGRSHLKVSKMCGSIKGQDRRCRSRSCCTAHPCLLALGRSHLRSGQKKKRSWFLIVFFEVRFLMALFSLPGQHHGPPLASKKMLMTLCVFHFLFFFKEAIRQEMGRMCVLSVDSLPCHARSCNC